MLFIIDIRPGGFRKNEPSQGRELGSRDMSRLPDTQLTAHESVTFPRDIPLEVAAPINSADSIKRRHGRTTIQDTTIKTSIIEMTSALDGSAGAGNHYVCRVTLTGPAAPAPAFSVFNPRTWRNQENTHIQLEMQIGTKSCPDWDHANLCLSAICDLVVRQDGYLDGAVVTALTTHLGAKVATSEAIQAN
jgi:hypothetical protein